ncbi:MAG: hypothetical protein EAZ44_03955 [Cytophagia bacterium]|nr:MAG: hypothetical protein EAZ44_03955 [Cytophagia bacterium]TAG43762.1 MAG: hypothetical protein EAZ31_03650 [Cytophagia bacterium]TAH31433.1 MAG: hypothetical protein EAZ06_00325 [Cytophagales bacterium]
MKKNIITLFLIIFVVSFFYSCAGGIGMKGQRGGSKIYEMYYIDSVTNQYFIKPLTFKNKIYSVDYDIVFRIPYKTQATLNFSLFSNENINKIDTFYIDNGSGNLKMIQIKKLLYKEKTRRKYHYRYSSQIDNHLLPILFDTKIKFVFNINKIQNVLLPTRKSIKKSVHVKENIIEFLKD